MNLKKATLKLSLLFFLTLSTLIPAKNANAIVVLTGGGVGSALVVGPIMATLGVHPTGRVRLVDYLKVWSVVAGIFFLDQDGNPQNASVESYLASNLSLDNADIQALTSLVSTKSAGAQSEVHFSEQEVLSSLSGGDHLGEATLINTISFMTDPSIKLILRTK